MSSCPGCTGCSPTSRPGRSASTMVCAPSTCNPTSTSRRVRFPLQPPPHPPCRLPFPPRNRDAGKTHHLQDVDLTGNSGISLWSDYQYALLWGHNEHKLQECLSGDAPENFAWHSPYALIQKGKYAGQVGSYLDAFGKKNVFIALFEGFVFSPMSVAQSVLEFIGSDTRIDETNSFHNVSRIVRSPSLVSARCLMATNRFFARLPLSWRNLLDDCYLAVNSRRGKIQTPDTVRTQLFKIYAEDIAKLSALLGRDLTFWLTAR